MHAEYDTPWYVKGKIHGRVGEAVGAAVGAAVGVRVSAEASTRALKANFMVDAATKVHDNNNDR